MLVKPVDFVPLKLIVENDVCDHPKCQELVVAYGKWPHKRIEPVWIGGRLWEKVVYERWSQI